MKAVNPDIKLYCSNPSCNFADESWRFAAFGGEDVTYRCPKCNSIASLSKATIIDVPKKEEAKTEVKGEEKMEELYFIVADFQKQSLRVMKESTVVDAGLGDSDIVLPMVDPEDIPVKQREVFSVSFDKLLDALDKGTLPMLPEVEEWIESIVHTPNNVEDVVPEKSDQAILFEEGFKAGFSSGVNFALKEKVFFESFKLINKPTVKGKARVLKGLRKVRRK